MFTEREEKINNLPYGDLVRAYNEGSLEMFVDRGLAMQAAASGLPTSNLASFAAIAFPISVVAAIAAAFLWSIWAALIILVIGIFCFRLSRAETVKSVRKAALENRELFEVLRKNKAIWFTESEGR